MSTSSQLEMHKEHKNWDSDINMWEQDMKMWLDELKALRDALLHVEVFVDNHEDMLNNHSKQFTSHSSELKIHERFMGLSDDILKEKHLEESQRHMALAKSHDRLKVYQHTLMILTKEFKERLEQMVESDVDEVK
ncbi:hypothetical protein [Fulvivirga lutimaris]|uniref:hypothetical protein n=1 Tax=Fulvivirga lutimaris TaxID=1819566 RepID=UPI0012BD4B41|nr:hypothetical protein [Fulvivirga lutimaris]MTI38922.1 hypothetical protein [Fulvivirga lutimaris]